MMQPLQPALVRRMICRGWQSPVRHSILARMVPDSLPWACICLTLHLEDSMRPLDAPPFLTAQRIEAFSDGVFAIAMTLLVLEIKVPQLQTPTPSGNPLSLRTALFQLWPSSFGYIFSFVVIGIYWANHHFIFHL
jgi:Endosomal/lysosomal potassium channel TMEM175